MTDGTLHGIGAGPGPRDLLTLRAKNLIETLPVVMVPSARSGTKSRVHGIISPYISEERIWNRSFPTGSDPNTREQFWLDTATEVNEELETCRAIGFVTLGDPLLYSSFSRLLHYISPEINVQICPGISSVQATAGQLKRPLLDRDQSFHLVPGTDLNRLEQMLITGDPVAILKPGINPGPILTMLSERNRRNHTAGIREFGEAGEQVLSPRDLDENTITYFTTLLVYPESISDRGE